MLVELDWAVYQLAWSATGPRYAYPMAAWLAIMPGSFRWERSQSLHEDAVLSHESACGLHGLGAEPSPLVTFTVPEEFEGPRATNMHVAALKPDEVSVVEGIPVTISLGVATWEPDTDLDPAELSVRNQRGYAALAHPDRVADLQPAVARLIPEGGGEALSWDIAAEIIGRT